MLPVKTRVKVPKNPKSKRQKIEIKNRGGGFLREGERPLVVGTLGTSSRGGLQMCKTEVLGQELTIRKRGVPRKPNHTKTKKGPRGACLQGKVVERKDLVDTGS